MEPYKSEMEGRSESSHPIKATAAWVIEPVYGYPWWGHMWAPEATAPVSGQQLPSEAPLEPCRTPLPTSRCCSPKWWKKFSYAPESPWHVIETSQALPTNPLCVVSNPFTSPNVRLWISSTVACLSYRVGALPYLFFYYQNNKFFKIL